MPDVASDLKQIVAAARRAVAADAGATIRALEDAATTLEMPITATELHDIGELLQSDVFKMMVVGRFKNGKSTLVNALLGKLTDPVPDLPPDRGPMPVDELPCTAIVTSVIYSQKPYVRVWNADRQWQEWSFARYLRDAVAQDSQEDTARLLHGIRSFEVGFPAELCQAGVMMMDSPGVDDVPERDEITRQAIKQCDAALVVYRSDVFGGMNEMRFVSEEVLGDSTRIFTVISMRNGREADERVRGVVWNKLIHEAQDGPLYSGQDFTAQDIFFVDSLKAFHAKISGDADALAASGLPLLEQRLGRFLAEESQGVHLRKFLHKADQSGAAVEEEIAGRRASFQRVAEDLERDYAAIQPQIAAARKRGAQLHRVFERRQREAQAALKASFEAMIAGLREDLPGEMAPKPLSTTGLTSTFRQKQLCAEAGALCQEIVTARLQTWSGAASVKSSADETQRPLVTAQETLAPILAGLLETISHEAQEIDQTLRAAQVQLTGLDWSLTAPTSIVGTNERILAGVAGLFVGDLSVLTGAAGGWRSVAGALGGQIGAVALLYTLGLAGSVVALPAVLIGGFIVSLLFSAEDIDKRVKAKVIQHADQGLAQMPAQAADAIDGEVQRLFETLEAETMKIVTASIDRKEAEFRKIMEMNRRDQNEKQQIIAQLDTLAIQVTGLRASLADAQAKSADAAAY